MKNASVEQYPLLSRTIFIAFAIVFLIMGIKLVLIEPFIGLANNGGFWRNMSEVGLWFCNSGTMTDCQIPYEQMYFGFTRNYYFYIEPTQSGFWTPYVLFLSLSRTIAHTFSPLRYDIRFIGAVNLLLYWSGVLTLISQIRARNKLPILLQILIVAGLLIFVSDSYILQYFNSFYAEPISLISTIWFVALFLAITNQKMIKNKYFLFLAQVIIGVFAASAKQQDSLNIFTFAIIVLIELFCFMLSSDAKRKFVSVLFGVLVIVGMISSVIYIAAKNDGGDSTVAYNAIMNGLLPFSSKKIQLLQSMGLSKGQAEELMPYVGQTAFENTKYWEYKDFFSLNQEIKLIVADPPMLVKSLIVRSKYLFTDVTYGNFQAIDKVSPYSKLGSYSRVWWQSIQLLFSKSLAFYLSIILLSIVLGCHFLNKFGYQRVQLLLVLLSLSNVTRFMVVMFGDANEDAKHLFMTNIEFFVIVLIFVYCFIHLIKRLPQNSGLRITVLKDKSFRLK